MLMNWGEGLVVALAVCHVIAAAMCILADSFILFVVELNTCLYPHRKLLASRRDNVLLNLIPYNPTLVAEDYHPPSAESLAAFHAICISAPYSIHCRVR